MQIDEQGQKQKRYFAGNCNLDAGPTGHRPVGGETKDGRHEAKGGRSDYAQGGHDQSVGQADQIGADIGAVAGVVDERQGDVKAGRFAEKAEPRGYAGLLEVSGSSAHSLP